jgi:hypothetical protein
MPGREPKVRPIGILLVGLPRMVRDLIEPIVAREKDMEIVGEGTADESLAGRVAATGAQVVIVGERDHEIPSVARDLLSERSLLRVIGLSVDRWHGTVHELKPHRQSIDVVDRENLVPVIRGLLRTAE